MARAFQPSFYLWAAGLPDSEHVRMLHTRAREVYADLGGVDVEDAIADYKAVVARWRAGAEGVGLREGLRCLGAIDRGNVRRDTLRERAWMQARAEVFQRTGRRIPLPNQSDRVANLIIGYEGGACSVRVAGSWRSERLISLEAPEDPAFDLYEDEHAAIDVSLEYRLDAHWRIRVDALNVFDRPLYEYFGEPTYAARYEHYGRIVVLGLAYRY